LAAVAAVSGELFLEDFPVESIQPDAVFVNMLKNMNVPVEMKDGVLHVSKAERLKGGNWNLIDCPDLFPVLAVLCGLAEGKSQLYGAPHLIYKESNRIDKTAELLDYIGARYEKKDDGMIIEGTTEDNRKKSFKFKTDEDHRLAFAAEVIRKAGYDKIKIKGEEVVNKSFPDFWDIMQGKK